MKFPISEDLFALLDVISDVGHPVIVGGAVRDFLFDGREPKDVDVEVFSCSVEALEKELSEHFKVDAVGKSFGVLKVVVTEGTEAFDVSLPRRESKEGRGHRGFIAEPDPGMTYEEAASRRDFTINSIGFDVNKGEFLDPHGGIQDLKDRVLRATSDHFSEDPLRVLRACQFAARFGFSIDQRTVDMCWALNSELAELPAERLWEEWKKLLLKAEKPSIGIEAMKATGALVLFPELAALLNVNQDPEWHPEGQDHPDGSLWIHNNMVVDEAAKIIRRLEAPSTGNPLEYPVATRLIGRDPDEALIVMLGALCHDFGKPATTEFIDGRWRARCHEEEGEIPTRAFLRRMKAPQAVEEAVVALVVDHLKPSMYHKQKSKPSAIRRLALRLHNAGTNLRTLVRVAEADSNGRTSERVLAGLPYEAGPWLLSRAGELKVQEKGPEKLLLGRHLIALGYAPGREMGVMLKEAFEAQLEGEFEDEDGAKAWAAERFGEAA